MTRTLCTVAAWLLIPAAPVAQAQVNSTLTPFDPTYPLTHYLAMNARWKAAEDAASKEEREQLRIRCRSLPDCEEIIRLRCSLGAGFLAQSLPAQQRPPGMDALSLEKRVGEHVVALRDKRLYTFALSPAQPGPRVVDAIDVAPASIDTLETWPVGLLVSGRSIYALSRVEWSDGYLLSRFTLTSLGQIRAEEHRWFGTEEGWFGNVLSAFMVGDALVFYLAMDVDDSAPTLGPEHYLYQVTIEPQWSAEELEQAVGSAGNRVSARARAHIKGTLAAAEAPDVAGDRLLRKSVLHRPVQQTGEPLAHLVLSCPTAGDTLSCASTGVIAPEQLGTFEGVDAVYLWVRSSGPAADYSRLATAQIEQMARTAFAATPPYGTDAILYRLPINGDAPSATAVRGFPLTHGAFHQTATELQIAVGSNPELLDTLEGEDRLYHFTGLDRPRRAPAVVERPALVRVPLDAFQAKVIINDRTRYDRLPPLAGYPSAISFLHERLLYTEVFPEVDDTAYPLDRGAVPQDGSGAFFAPSPRSLLRSLTLRGNPQVLTREISFPVEHIVATDHGAVLVGGAYDAQDLPQAHVQALALTPEPAPGQHHILPRSHITDERTHLLSFTDTGGGVRSNLLLVPTVRYDEADPWDDDPQKHDLDGEVGNDLAWQLFDINEPGALNLAGLLRPTARASASCDWDCELAMRSGDAWAVFGHIYLQAGYDLIRARRNDGLITELGRAIAYPR